MRRSLAHLNPDASVLPVGTYPNVKTQRGEITIGDHATHPQMPVTGVLHVELKKGGPSADTLAGLWHLVDHVLGLPCEMGRW